MTLERKPEEGQGGFETSSELRDYPPDELLPNQPDSDVIISSQRSRVAAVVAAVVVGLLVYLLVMAL